MTTREDASALIQRMQECFNTRQFEQAADLHTPGFFSHPLGTTGFEAGKNAWRTLVARYPGIRVAAQDILVDGDKAAVRSTVEGIALPDENPQPVLFEIFRIADGRLAEMWGATAGFPPSASPEELLSLFGPVREGPGRFAAALHPIRRASWLPWSPPPRRLARPGFGQRRSLLPLCP